MTSHTRRHMIGLAALGLSAALLPLPGLAVVRGPRRLRFAHTHTSEKLDVVYYEDGSYHPDAIAEINYLLRDFRSGDIRPIDPGLLDLLSDVYAMTGSRKAFQVISGYRSPATNAMLRRQDHGVARRSQHMQGRAIDVRLGDVESNKLRDAALQLRRGGVGFYAASDFVHLDTGRVRTW